jgi:hypothetical protein
MEPIFLTVAAIVALLLALLFLGLTQLVLLTYGWAFPLFVALNAVALGWSFASGDSRPGIGILAATVFAFYGHFRREQRRTRILSHCIAALFSEAVLSGRYTSDQLLEFISNEITQDFWVRPLDKFARRDAQLFDETHLSNGGFPAWYRALHAKIASEWSKAKSRAADSQGS